MNAELPPKLPGTVLRILGTSDLGATSVPLRTSYGESGTVAGIESLLDDDTIWLDLGDLVVGNPSYPLLRERPWADVERLPIAAAAAGNHDFDDGREALPRLPFPHLCANADVGLDATAMVGDLGVIGLTHSQVHCLAQAPEPYPDWQDRVVEHARALRRDGARWVVALVHEGATWWPDGEGIATRTGRLEAIARPWAQAVDLILGGHDFGAWSGRLAGTPAAEPHLFASSVAVVDLAPQPVVRGVFRVPPVRGAATTATKAIDAAAARVVGQTDAGWLTRTAAEHYLPDLLARAFAAASGAEAGFAPPNHHGIQAPFDGAIAALGPGPVTELDVVRLFAALDYDLVVAELRPGELRRAADAFWAAADPRNRAADALHWNWCRMPAGVSGDGTSVAMLAAVLPGVCEWLGHDVEASPAGIDARSALTSVLG
ncbi:metallophosphoesterase [Candidatus Solirubrobacter pratensis]|uniref:metallophosphoesterase n=1 Tax=Candidatus Solirubrobacter pratensis TaxID=1298857 RepID=UPI0003FEA2F7|nr:metallophosphoesterase [Candidatus Solirubrobacter pratensis]